MQNNAGKTAFDLELNVGALVCYLNICLPIGFVYSIIVLVQDKENKLPRFHAFQSLLANALAVVISIIAVIFVFIAMFLDVMIGTLVVFTGIVGLVAGIIGIGFLVVVIISAVKAYKGEIYKIPIIGNMADNWSN